MSLSAELPMFEQLRAAKANGPIDIVLFTHGGAVEAPWRFISLARELSSSVSVLLPHRALSSGTLMALGADEIVMTPLSVLGPIDPSRAHHLLPRGDEAKAPEQVSVQDMRHAMQFIRENSDKTAYTADAMAQIFGALFDKIHPLAIGAIEQSYALAKLVGTRCLESHMDKVTEAAKIKAIVDRLCDEYKSHSYQISRKEAKEIGLNVTNADAETEEILLSLLKFYTARPIGPFGLVKPGLQVTAHIAWMDSLRLHFRVEQVHAVGPKQELEPRGDQWVSY